jgi:hypothetical protein
MWPPTSATESLLTTERRDQEMFTIDSSLAAEIDYRSNRVRESWAPRRRRIRSVKASGRRLDAGPRTTSIGTVATAR